MRFRTLLTLLAAASTVLATGGCFDYERDYYGEAFEACNYIPSGWGLRDLEPSYQKTSLKPECKAVLESILPIDDASFALAPEGFKNKVLEAFQAILAFPVALPPDLSILGARPKDAGAIPLSLLKIFRSDSNLNRALFNYVARSADVFRYDPDPNFRHTAYYWFSDGVRSITFYPPFWEPTDADAVFQLPFQTASILLHEARHGDWTSHTPCINSWDNFCDLDLQGPYGMSLIYPLLVAYGNAERISRGEDALRWQQFAFYHSYTVCDYIQGAFRKVPAEIAAVVEGRVCAWEKDSQWFFDRLSIPWSYPLTPFPHDPFDVPSYSPKVFPIDP